MKTKKFRLPRKLKKRLSWTAQQDMKFSHEFAKGFKDLITWGEEHYHVSNTGEIKNIPFISIN